MASEARRSLKPGLPLAAPSFLVQRPLFAEPSSPRRTGRALGRVAAPGVRVARSQVSRPPLHYRLYISRGRTPADRVPSCRMRVSTTLSPFALSCSHSIFHSSSLPPAIPPRLFHSFVFPLRLTSPPFVKVVRSLCHRNYRNNYCTIRVLCF